jgi:hypothetical protein
MAAAEVHGALLWALRVHAAQLQKLGHITQARALRADARYMARRARLHLRKLGSER